MLRGFIRKTLDRAVGVIARLLPQWIAAPVVDTVPQIEWTRVTPPLNIGDLPIPFASQFVRAKNIPERRIFQLRNVCVTPEGVTFRNMRIFIPSLPWLRDLESYQRGEFLSKQWQGTLRSIDNDPLILAFDHWALSNYYHWMIESLPRLYIAKVLFKEAKILIPDDVHEYVSTSLELLGLKNLVRINAEETIHVPHLIMPEIVYYNGVENENDPPSQSNVFISHPLGNEELIVHVRKKLLEKFPPKKPFRKVYVSRSKSRMRKVVNEDAILPALEASGFEIVFFEGMSLIEQIRLMQETSVLAGVHGSNMVNILFLPDTARVIELMNEHQLNDAFYLLSSTIGINYYSVPCTMADETIKHSSDSVLINDADLVVDVDRFKSLLRRIFMPMEVVL